MTFISSRRKACDISSTKKEKKKSASKVAQPLQTFVANDEIATLHQNAPCYCLIRLLRVTSFY